MVKSIIFDMDGTLVDSQESILEGFKQALECHKIESIIPLSREIVGPPLVETLQKITGLTNKVKIHELLNSFIDIYDSSGYTRTVEYDGIGPLLKALKREGARLFIATNKRYVPTIKILEHFNWTAYFEGVYAIDSSPLGRFGSKAETIANLKNDYLIEANQAVYVGDRLEDFVAAQSNNIETVLVSWGYGTEADLNSCVAKVVYSPDELKGFLLKVCA